MCEVKAGEARVIRLSEADDYQPLLEGRPVTFGMRSGRVALGPGERCGEHTTGDHEETLVFLSGTGTAHVEGAEPLAVGAGMVAYIPPQTRHDIEAGPDGLRYVYVVAPVRGVE